MASFAAPLFLLVSPLLAGTPRVCGAAGGDSLATYQDSARELAVNVSGVLGAGASQLYGFPDIQGLVASASKICLTGMPLSKNIYQYDRFLFVIRGEDASGALWTVPLVFQAASVQAYENVGVKPWLGFSGRDLSGLVKAALDGVELKEAALEPGTPFSPLDFAVLPTGGSAADRGYVLVPDVDPGWTTYLVSQLRPLSTGNVFTSQSLLDVAVVQLQAGGRVRYGALRGFFGAASAMEDAQIAAAPSDLKDRPARLARLKELSR